MRIELTEHFKKSYKAAPLRIRKDFQKQGRFLLQNLRHPSLRAKKYDESKDIWQARVNPDTKGNDKSVAQDHNCDNI